MSFWIHKSVIRENRVFKSSFPALKRMNSYENESEASIVYQPVKVYEKAANEDDILYD